MVASCPTQACLNAWIYCENLLLNLPDVKASLSQKVTKVLDECALICMGTFHALKKGSTDASRLALLCVGICEECADLCEREKEEEFQICAKTCRECSETISELAFTAL